jgi:hypothetical protein
VAPARHALETFTAYGDRRGTGNALLVLSAALIELHEVDEAVEMLVRAMGEFDVLGDKQGRAEAERLTQEAHRRRI